MPSTLTPQWSQWFPLSPLARTLVVVNLASIVERADETLLPAVYNEVGNSFHVSVIALGYLTFIRGLVQALTSPWAAYLANHYDRARIIGLGAISWGIATAAVGASQSYFQIALARALNGVGLAVTIPAIQSLVADSYSESSRGTGFGILQLINNSGTIVGGVFATILAGSSPFGIAGWRMAFYTLAVISVLIGALVCRYAEDPRFPSEYLHAGDDPESQMTSQSHNLSTKERLTDLWAGSKRVLSLRTFQLIIAQGVVGSFPWNAMAFFTLWLELVGFSHHGAAALVACFSVGNTIGSLAGGCIGDWAARKYPDGGRILCSQFSSGVAVPLSFILLVAIPEDSRLGVLFGTILFLTGFLISWNAPATNNPIFAEIVPVHLRTTIYAFDRAFEGVISAFGAPTVGYLAEHQFGYKLNYNEHLNKADAQQQKKGNARALANGLFFSISIPFVICCLTYTMLYWTYPQDRDKVRAEALGNGLELSQHSKHGDGGRDEGDNGVLVEGGQVKSPRRRKHGMAHSDDVNGQDDESAKSPLVGGSSKDGQKRSLESRKILFVLYIAFVVGNLEKQSRSLRSNKRLCSAQVIEGHWSGQVLGHCH